jgi:hypothetical protein
MDRDLYLPRSWTDDEQRCADAGVPAETSFQKKPQLAAGDVSQDVLSERSGVWPATLMR